MQSVAFLSFSRVRAIWRAYLERSIQARREVHKLPRAYKMVIFCIASAALKDPVRIAAVNLGEAIAASGHDPNTCHCEILGTVLTPDPHPQFLFLASEDLRDAVKSALLPKA